VTTRRKKRSITLEVRMTLNLLVALLNLKEYRPSFYTIFVSLPVYTTTARMSSEFPM